MSLYLGNSEKLKIRIDNVVYTLNLFSEVPITNFAKILSLDGFMLKDSNGVFLTVEESD